MKSQDVISWYRTLGLPICATQKEIKNQRKRLMHQFHPDKNQKDYGISPESRFNEIDAAYKNIIQSFDEIQAFFGLLKEDQLTSRHHRRTKSHWVYQEIQQYVD